VPPRKETPQPAYTPAVDRTTLVEGPAHIICPDGTTYLWADGSVAVDLVTDFNPISAAGFGNLDEARRADERIEASFPLAGNMPAAALTYLFSTLGTAQLNTSVHGASDAAWKVHALDGTLITIKSGAIHELPTLRMGAANRRWDGNAKIVGVIGKNMARTDAGALYTRATAQAFSAVPTLAEFVNLPVKATWGENEIATVDGWKVSIRLGLSPRRDPNVGTFDYRLTSIAVEARARPLNLDDSLLATAYVVGASTRIGASRTGANLLLVEDNPGLSVTLNNAVLVSNPVAFGPDEPRLGELTWRARRDFTSGYGALFSVTATPA
jgi:hypothetical protein